MIIARTDEEIAQLRSENPHEAIAIKKGQTIEVHYPNGKVRRMQIHPKDTRFLGPEWD